MTNQVKKTAIVAATGVAAGGAQKNPAAAPAATPVCTKVNCATCGAETKGGMKYENICTVCEPVYLQRCSGCERRLWDCMCIRPHTWE